MDGVRQGYYSEEELELQKIEEFSAWEGLKAFLLFFDPREAASGKLPDRVSSAAGGKRRGSSRPMELGWPAEQVQGLYLNVQYENHGLTCITGVSLNVFSMDRTLEREWDQAVREFLKKNGVAAAEA